VHILTGQKRVQVNFQMLHLKFLEKQEQAKPKASKRREIIKISVKINAIETTTKKLYKESMKQKTGSLKNKQDLQTPGKPD
jgi:hypothetical protein